MEHVKNKIIDNKNKIIGIIMYVCFLLIMNITFYTKMINESNVPKKWILVYAILSMFVSIIVGGLIVFVNKQKNIKPEKLFVISAIFLSTTYMFATPLFKGHDEQYQWYRGYEISLGKVKTIVVNNYVGNMLPAQVGEIYGFDGNFTNITYRTAVATWKHSIETRNDENLKEYTFIETSPTASYSPLQMLPQALGITIARVLRFDIYSQGMIGRLFNVILFIISGYFSIKFMPNKKYLILAILLSPKVLYISSTLSSDNIINMTILLFTTYIFKLRAEKKYINWKNILFLMILTPFIAASKFVYIPICALILLLPKECFKKNINKVITIVAIFGLAFVSFLTWKSVQNISFANPESQTGSQIGYLLSHPVSYLGLLVRSVCENFVNWSLDTIGGYMEWGKALSLPEIVSIIIYGVLLLTIMNDEEEKDELKLWEKLLIIGIILAVTAAIITAMYSACVQKIGATYIEGVQGKYFVPIIALAFIIIPTKYIKAKNKLDMKYIYIVMLLCQIPALLNIFVRNIR